jgi:hypothetical protein
MQVTGGLSITFDTRLLTKLGNDTGKYDRRLLSGLLEIRENALIVGAQVARKEAPVFRGELSSSIMVEPPVLSQSPDQIILSGDIHTGDMSHAIVMEEGRLAGSRTPPISAIRRWLIGKAIPSGFDLPPGPDFESRVTTAAITVARSIARKGTRAFKFMHKASLVVETMMVTGVLRLIDQVANDIEND